MTTKKEPMPEIEITEADREAVACLLDMVTAASAEGMPLQDCHEIWRQAFARHRLAATAAGESRVAEAVKAERARIKKIVCDYALSIHDPYDVSAAWALENVARMLTPTPEATT